MRKIQSKEDEEIEQKISEQFIVKAMYDREKKKCWYDNKNKR